MIAAPSGLSGAVTAAHLHLAATDGINHNNFLIHLCGTGGTASCTLDNGQGQTFTVNLPTTLLSPVPLIYLNLHTGQNPGGKIRGQLTQLTGPTPVSTAQGTWSTAQLSVARSSLAATSVGNVAFFAGGYTGNCSFCVV